MYITSHQPEPIQITEAEYLEFEAQNEIKHEFVNGEVFAMTGGSVRHNLISNNTSRTLMNQLEDKDCIVLSGDTRLRVDAKVSYRDLDVMVICGKVKYVNNRVDTVSNPIPRFHL